MLADQVHAPRRTKDSDIPRSWKVFLKPASYALFRASQSITPPKTAIAIPA
jgi:hypothetical protein